MLHNFTNNIQALPKPLRFIRVLEHYEVDILTEYKSEEGNYIYLEKWCDTDEERHRYLIVRSDIRPLALYLAKQMDMLTLLRYSSDGFGFIIDKNINGETTAVYRVLLSDLPAEYLPSADAYHELELRPEWDVIPLHYTLESNWNGKIIAETERRLITAAGFAFHTEPDTQRRIPPFLLNYWFDGGWSYAKTNEKIRESVPVESQSKPYEIQAASPGILTIASPSGVVNQIHNSLKALSDSEELYREVASWSRKKMDNFNLIPDDAYIQLNFLCISMHINVNALFPDPTPNIPDPAGNKRTVLIAAKLVISYIRNLKKLVNPQSGIQLISLDLQSNSIPQITQEEEELEAQEALDVENS